METKTKKILIGVIILMVIAITVWWWIETARLDSYITENYNQPPVIRNQTSDTVEKINNDLQQIDLGNIDAGFQEIDKEINNL